MWNEIRRDFPITQNGIYLDHAAGGPIPRPVLEVIQQFQKENSEGADFHWLDWMQRRDEARQSVAQFIGALPEEIAFITSASHGMNLIAELLVPEGEVLLNESEFPTSTVPWLWRKARTVFQPTEDFKITPENMQTYLTPKIKTIVTSYVQYGTGYRQDIAGIGKIKGDRFLAVNATQGWGALPFDVRHWNADFVCTNSYKWMMAGYGGGVLYIRKPWLDRFRPSGAGWRSMVNCDLMQNKNIEMKKAGERYEWGCPNFAAMFGFAAATRYFTEIGVGKIEARILKLTDFLIQGLQQKGFEVLSPLEPRYRSGVVVFRVEQPITLWKKLLAQKIYVSPRGEGLRVAPHFYNTEDEIQIFLEQLNSLI